MLTGRGYTDWTKGSDENYDKGWNDCKEEILELLERTYEKTDWLKEVCTKIRNNI